MRPERNEAEERELLVSSSGTEIERVSAWQESSSGHVLPPGCVVFAHLCVGQRMR